MPTNGSSKTLNIGVLGCGPIAQAAHLDSVNRAHNATLHAICDLAEDLRNEMAARHHPQKVYSDIDSMLADPDIDAVIIAIADQFHVSAALRTVEAGKHVLIEKPVGVTVEEAAQIARAAQQSGLIVQVGNMKRFDPGIQFARDFIQSEMGEVLALKAWYCDSTYRYRMTDNVQPLIVTSPAAKRPLGDPKSDKQRYFLLGHGSHLVDTARFLGGEIVAVRARLVEKFGAYCWFIDTEYANGAAGHLDLTIAVRMDWHEGFQIYGEHGSVLGKTPNPWFLKSSEVECFSTKDNQYHRVLGEDGHAYRRQIEAFADVILNGAPQTGATAEDGLAAVRTLVAIARSAESGDRVALSGVTGSP